MEKVNLYKKLHEKNPQYGRGGVELLPVIKPLIDFLKPKSILDYGCGKGNLVKVLAENYPNIKVYGYDPAVREFENIPVYKVDFVICTDVLEHIPENELPSTIYRIAGLSDKVFFHLHHGKASAVLENGENAHCTIYSPAQYVNLFKKFFTTLNFLPGFGSINTCCVTFQIPQNIAKNWELLLHGNAINYVDNLNQLIQLIHSREEVIIFPIGGEGQILLDFMRYANLLDRVACIAAPQVENGVAQKFVHEVPIIPFENLVHFCETALIIVATSEQPQNAALNAELKLVGFKSVVFIKNNVHIQVRNELQKLYGTGQVLMWYVQHFDKEFNDLKLRVYEQNEVADVNKKAFSEYRNAFRGKKIVIVGGGPTANYYTPIKDAIHIGLNFAWKREDIAFDYLFTQDASHRETITSYKDVGFDRIKNKIFIGKYLNSTPFNWITFPEDYALLKNNIVRYFSGFSEYRPQVFQDICCHAIVDFGSVSFEALHFALFTYPDKIYLVGCDTTTGKGHFYENDSKKQSLDTKAVKVGYARMKMFAKQYYPETEIISINPVGLRGLFEDVYTKEYMASLNEKT